MESKQHLPHYTYDDYRHWEGRWEVIGGIPFAMSPAPAPKHQRISAALVAQFYQQLRNCTRCQVYQPLDYLVGDDTILQPDLLVVCAPILKKYLDFTPDLLVEVVSPSSVLKDRETKFNIYQSQGLPYYLLISPEDEIVEVFQLGSGEYTLVARGHEPVVRFGFSDCLAEINFGEIW